MQGSIDAHKREDRFNDQLFNTLLEGPPRHGILGRRGLLGADLSGGFQLEDLREIGKVIREEEASKVCPH